MGVTVERIFRWAVVIPLATAAVVGPVYASRVHATTTVSTRATAVGAGGQHQRGLRDIAAHPDYYAACTVHGPNNPTCIKQELAAIKHARSHEPGKTRRMVLPRNYRTLNPVRQTFVVTNLERVDRGLRPIAGLTHALNERAQLGADSQADPSVPTSLMQALHLDAWGSIWAGDLGPLAADYDWMYNDGYAPGTSPNVDCTSRHAAGCWGHRRNILGSYEGLPSLTAGVGEARATWLSIAEVISGGTGAAARFSYTWKQALAHGANRHLKH